MHLCLPGMDEEHITLSVSTSSIRSPSFMRKTRLLDRGFPSCSHEVQSYPAGNSTPVTYTHPVSWAGEMTGPGTAISRLQETMQTGAMYVNKELDPQYPAFAMPVSNGSFSIALVELYDLPASRYTIYYRNLFQTLVQMVQHNLVQAYTYQMENREKLFVPGTDILTAEAFARERKTLQMASEEYGYPSSIARILPVEQAGGQGLAPAQLSGRAEPLLRGTDLLGMGQDGQVRAGFLYLDRASRPVVEHRFALHGLRLVWED